MTDAATVALSDGRRLAYEEYGRADGRPVFCFHGNPGSRLLWTLLDEPAQHRDVHIVAPDRPGFGVSTDDEDRSLLDWPADVRALAEAVGADEFAVVGFSAGGPHALACAHALSERVTRAVLVSTVPPPSTVGPVHQRARGAVLASPADTPSLSGATTDHDLGIYAGWRSIPGVARGLFGAAGWLARNWRRRFRAALEHTLSAADAELFRQPDGDVILTDAVEAFRQGSQGPAHEFRMLGEEWGLDLEDVSVPVSLWHGDRDRLVDAGEAETFGDSLAEGEVSIVDAGHYSTLVDNDEAILCDAVSS